MKRIASIIMTFTVILLTTISAHATELEGAVIKEQGVTFAIISVKSYVVHNQTEANKAIYSLQMMFKMPVVLVSLENGQPYYFGRKDIVKFMSNVEPYRIPWRKYNIR
jgi:hypothetical protein